jgi:hypothetical protein
MTHLERMVVALMMVAPWALRVRYPDRACCIPAAHCGAAALRKRRIDARAIPCALVAQAAGSEAGIFVGHTAASAYKFISEHSDGSEPMPAFDEWRAMMGSFPEEVGVHMAIEATLCGKRAFIDLTLGQVQDSTRGSVHVPDRRLWWGSGWPSEVFENGTAIAYMPHPDRSKIDPATLSYENRGLTDDFSALMDVALSVDLDAGRFLVAIERVVATGGFAPDGVDMP